MKVQLKFLMLSMVVAGLVGCAADAPGVYRGGQRIEVGVIDVKEHYAFRFMDKWRISHAWLSGVKRGCEYATNSYKRLGGYGDLESERNAPFVERGGVLGQLTEYKRKWSVSTSYANIYGTRRGKFERYEPFCNEALIVSSDLLGLFIVKPDSAKGTDDWIEGAKPVQLNGLTWLFKEIPPQDMTGNKEGKGVAPIEIWVLKIPDTPYWMMLRFSADLKYSIQEHPTQHYAMLDLFHRIVASVKLEPLSSEPAAVDSTSPSKAGKDTVSANMK